MNTLFSIRIRGKSSGAFIFLLSCLALLALPEAKGQIRAPQIPSGGIAEITASGPQRREGAVYIADQDVDIHYAGMRLQADHVEYNTDTSDAAARGHVIFDYENQHLEGDEANLNVGTGRGTFLKVRGMVRLERRANPLLLVSENPLYFEAEEVDRLSEDVYDVRHAWFTICEPQSPTWQFYAPRA